MTLPWSGQIKFIRYPVGQCKVPRPKDVIPIDPLRVFTIDIQPVLSEHPYETSNLLAPPSNLSARFHALPDHLEEESLLQVQTGGLHGSNGEESMIKKCRIFR